MDFVLGNNIDDKIRVVVVTGACRSGKTTLSKILGSMRNIEWIEEPYGLLQLPILEHFNFIDRKMAVSFIRATVKELFNDNILLRNGNFRSNDLSSIWNIKKSSDIFSRLNDIKTRDDVRNYINKNNSIILIDLPEIHPFIDILYESFSNIKIIHVVRNGLNVAKQVESKQWFIEEELLSPKNNSLFYKYKENVLNKEYFLPWWVKEKEMNNFINYSEFSKGLYYWFRMMSYNDFYKKEKSLPNYKIIRYEDLVLKPTSIIEELAEFLDVEKTNITNELLNEIHKDELQVSIYNNVEDIGKDIIMQIEDIMENYGYKL